MPEILSYSFMQQALGSSILIGLLCSIIGVFVVLKGLAFIGAGTAHAAFAGVALGYLIGFHPLIMAILFGLLTVWITGALEQTGKLKPDVVIGIFYTFAMALAILFIGLMKTYNSEVYGYLFGSVLSVSAGDLLVIFILGSIVLLIVFLFFKEFHFIVYDQALAEASGIPAKPLFFLLLNLIAITIVVSMKTVGAVLVFAMLVIPAASAYQLTHSMRGMLIYSAAFGLLSSVGGVLLSFWFDVPSGATIVIAATTLFFIAVIVSPKRRSGADRTLKAAFLVAGLLLILPKTGMTAEVREANSPLASIKFLTVHAHRYQNFEQNRIDCEIFGEFQNIGTRKIRSFTLEIKLLDAENKTVAMEALVIIPLSISREAPRGVVKAIGPKDYGYFSMNTVNCPTHWLEGKIKYEVSAVELD